MSEGTFVCLGRRQALPEPGECNWPTCSCDPKASEVIAHFQECGLTLVADSLVHDWSEQGKRHVERLREIDALSAEVAALHSRVAELELRAQLAELERLIDTGPPRP